MIAPPRAYSTPCSSTVPTASIVTIRPASATGTLTAASIGPPAMNVALPDQPPTIPARRHVAPAYLVRHDSATVTGQDTGGVVRRNLTVGSAVEQARPECFHRRPGVFSSTPRSDENASKVFSSTIPTADSHHDSHPWGNRKTASDLHRYL